MSVATDVRPLVGMHIRSGPLASRDTNVCLRPARVMSSITTREKLPRASPPKHMRHSNQYSVPDHEKRRRTYLNKVHQNGDDKKWDTRCEQILREDFLAYQRQWTESQECSAPTILEYSDVDEINWDVKRQDDEMIDHVLSQETEELEALITMLQDRSKEGNLGLDESARHGSDEESYDSIFMEILNNNRKDQTLRSNTPHVDTDVNAEVDSEAMDTTGGTDG
ncbi:MAG: hypothetical protein Q9225_002771 [Loekoesia sp. 1 TL-2023]